MDVTSLLNSTAAGARQQRDESTERSTTPSTIEQTSSHGTADTTPSPRDMAPKRPVKISHARPGRIPWDAGGYSLALALETKSSTAAGRPPLFAESPNETGSPKSPWHRMSESHSSRSSHASSSSFWSQAHSRYSSISTVNGLPTIPDVSTLEIAAKIEGQAQADANGRRDVPFLELPRSVSPSDGPISPSDAVMFRGVSRIDSNLNVTEATNPMSRQMLQVDYSSKHKRTISAPDMALTDGKAALTPQTSPSQPSTPSSDSSDTTPTYGMEASGSLSGTGSRTGIDGAEQIKCMYVDNCDTNSSLRKAISHIFGRNKLCTRMIPAHVWVHYCRKHYQRSRYRNAQEYAKLQAELVQKQVTRIQAWSDANKTSGQGSVVINWSISMRKREQNRVQERSKKRSLTRDSEEDEESADRAVANGTAVPEWLRNKCGEGYSTAEIENITSQLKENVDNGTLAQIPDIEILPNISADPSEDVRARGVLKRKTSTVVAHRRSQSTSVQPVSTSERQAIQGIPFIRTEEAYDMFQARKRPRAEPLHHHDGYFAKGYETASPIRGPGASSLYGLPHRPAPAHYGENYCASPYDTSRLQPSQRPGLAVPPRLQLHALSSSRGAERPRRLSHGRSQSDVAGFNHHNNNEFTFRSPPPTSTTSYTDSRPPLSSLYAPSPYASESPYTGNTLSTPLAYHQAPRSAHEHGFSMHRLPSWNPTTSGTQLVSDPSLFTLHRHSRNQSTPLAYQHSPPREVAMAGGPYDGHHSYHRR